MTTLGLTKYDAFAATAEAERHRREVDAAVAAERARCAAVCREVAAEYEGHAGAVARQCAEAVERGPSAPGVG